MESGSISEVASFHGTLVISQLLCILCEVLFLMFRHDILVRSLKQTRRSYSAPFDAIVRIWTPCDQRMWMHAEVVRLVVPLGHHDGVHGGEIDLKVW